MNNFKHGDVVLFTSRSKRGEEQRTAIILDTNKAGELVIEGIDGYGYMPTGQGAFKPEEVGTKPFGFYCAAKVIDHLAPVRHSNTYQSLPGDRGYDLMC